LELQNEQLSGLLCIQQAVLASSGLLQKTYDIIVDHHAVMPQATGAAIELIEGNMLRYAAIRDSRPEVKNMQLPLVGSLSGLAILTGNALVCEDCETDGRVDLEACRRVGLRSMIVTPIPYRGAYVGVLKFYADKPGMFGDFDELISQLLVGIIAAGLSQISETEALEMQGKLIEAVQLKQEFVSMVSHELKSPIAALLGALPLAEDAVAKGDAVTSQRLIGIALRNAERMKLLVNDLMDVHAIDEGHLTVDWQEVDLPELVGNVLLELEPTAKAKNVEFVLTAPRGPLLLTTDPNRLAQAIVNIIANAIRFSPTGGIVAVKIGEEAGQATIRIEDQGPGVPKAFRDKLFTRFARARDAGAAASQQGTGLGLFISQNILHELSGSIQLDTRFRSGARFIIRLPLEKQN
jgi:signal transduction histidine kinase